MVNDTVSVATVWKRVSAGWSRIEKVKKKRSSEKELPSLHEYWLRRGLVLKCAGGLWVVNLWLGTCPLLQRQRITSIIRHKQRQTSSRNKARHLPQPAQERHHPRYLILIILVLFSGWVLSLLVFCATFEAKASVFGKRWFWWRNCILFWVCFFFQFDYGFWILGLISLLPFCLLTKKFEVNSLTFEFCSSSVGFV